MKLNPDCIRDVLLVIEDKPYGEIYYLDNLIDKLPDYSEDEISYCCVKLKEAGFLEVGVSHYTGSLTPTVTTIREITFIGHQFLDNVRNDSVWQETKSRTESIGSVAINVLSQVAANIISSRLGF